MLDSLEYVNYDGPLIFEECINAVASLSKAKSLKSLGLGDDNRPFSQNSENYFTYSYRLDEDSNEYKLFISMIALNRGVSIPLKVTHLSIIDMKMHQISKVCAAANHITYLELNID